MSTILDTFRFNYIFSFSFRPSAFYKKIKKKKLLKNVKANTFYLASNTKNEEISIRSAIKHEFKLSEVQRSQVSNYVVIPVRRDEEFGKPYFKPLVFKYNYYWDHYNRNSSFFFYKNNFTVSSNFEVFSNISSNIISFANFRFFSKKKISKKFKRRFFKFNPYWIPRYKKSKPFFKFRSNGFFFYYRPIFERFFFKRSIFFYNSSNSFLVNFFKKFFSNCSSFTSGSPFFLNHFNFSLFYRKRCFEFKRVVPSTFFFKKNSGNRFKRRFFLAAEKHLKIKKKGKRFVRPRVLLLNKFYKSVNFRSFKKRFFSFTTFSSFFKKTNFTSNIYSKKFFFSFFSFYKLFLLYKFSRINFIEKNPFHFFFNKFKFFFKKFNKLKIKFIKFVRLFKFRKIRISTYFIFVFFFYFFFRNRRSKIMSYNRRSNIFRTYFTNLMFFNKFFLTFFNFNNFRSTFFYTFFHFMFFYKHSLNFFSFTDFTSFNFTKLVPFKMVNDVKSKKFVYLSDFYTSFFNYYNFLSLSRYNDVIKLYKNIFNPNFYSYRVSFTRKNGKRCIFPVKKVDFFSSNFISELLLRFLPYWIGNRLFCQIVLFYNAFARALLGRKNNNNFNNSQICHN